MTEHTPVIIVGGGPIGLAAGYVLGQHGIRSIICEQFVSINPHPRAHVVNTRSMELFRSWGIAEKVKADAIDPSWLLSFIWRTSIAGEELGRVFLGELPEAEVLRRMFASIEGVQSCAQDLVQRHLLDAVVAQGMADVRVGAKVVGIESDSEMVRVTVAKDRTETLVTADFAIGADGALSWVRDQVGIKMKGMPPLGQQINVYFHADLSGLVGDQPGVLYWAINSRTRGVFIAMDGVKRWTFNIEYNRAVESVDDYPPERCVAILHDAIGAEIDVDVKSVGTWTMTAETAGSYNSGRVYLAGDAAHRFPPTGGLGMNTGLVDADNLAWKLAAVINGWAPPELLESYEAERKPVALSNAQQSITNAISMAGTGIGPNGAEVAARLESEDPSVATEERARLRAEIDKQLAHFDALNLEIGYRYDRSPIVSSDGTPSYVPEDPARDFDSDAQPGARLPHSELLSDGATISTLDLVGPDFLLLTGERGGAWIDALDKCAVSVPTRAVQIGVDIEDVNGTFFDTVGIETGGCLLIRPDGHVAFRSPSATDKPCEALDRALRRAIGRPPN